MGEWEKKPILISTTEANYRELLEKLATDDEFRERMEANPHQVLLEHGLHVHASDLPETITLPSKEELEARLDTELGLLPFLYWMMAK